MSYDAKDYGSLPEMEGFSDELSKDHFELDESDVSQTNELVETLAIFREADADTNESSELTRRRGWEFDGIMRLHELYVSNLGGSGLAPSGGISDALTAASVMS